MARLDDARMDRSDGHFVDFRAHPEEISQAADRRRGATATAGRRARETGPASDQGWPAGTTPCCSQISRSNQWACGQSGVGDGYSDSTEVASTRNIDWESWATAAIRRNAPSPRGCANSGNPPALHNGVEHLAAETFHVEVSPVSGCEGLADYGPRCWYSETITRLPRQSPHGGENRSAAAARKLPNTSTAAASRSGGTADQVVRPVNARRAGGRRFAGLRRQLASAAVSHTAHGDHDRGHSPRIAASATR